MRERRALGSQLSSSRGAQERERPACLGGGGHSKVLPPPLPAMWQLKEPSKPKCVCARTQFITAEHMANILTHVSRARKTNRARGAGERPPPLGLRGRRRAGAGRVGPPGPELEPGGGVLAAPVPERPRLRSRPGLRIKSGRGSARSRPGAPCAAALQVSLPLARVAGGGRGTRGARLRWEPHGCPASPPTVGRAQSLPPSQPRRRHPQLPGTGTRFEPEPCGGRGRRGLGASLALPSCAGFGGPPRPPERSPLATPASLRSPSLGGPEAAGGQVPGVTGPSPAPLVTRGALGKGPGPALCARGREKFYLMPRPGAPTAAHFPARGGAGPSGAAVAGGEERREERRGGV